MKDPVSVSNIDKIQCFKSVREISIVDLSRLTHKFNNSYNSLIVDK